jgi:hypothetical protein
MGLSSSRPKDNEKETIPLQHTDTIIHGDGHTNINVLVVCSLKRHKRRRMTDYSKLHEIIFSHFYPEDNKKINVQFIDYGDLKTLFPDDVMDQKYNDSFNMIWFAGCNCLKDIFYSPVESIEKAYKILKDDGIIIFTEDDNYKIQRTKIKNINNPTMKIQNMKQDSPTMKIQNMKQDSPTMKIQNMKQDSLEKDQIKKANVISIFKQYFEENRDYIKENPYCVTFFRPFSTASINNDLNDHQDVIISYKKRFDSDSVTLSNRIIQRVQQIQNNHRNATRQPIGQLTTK